MATKQRVQVRDLADAPRLQATIQSGGNYNVAVQQAGDNKMLQLARSLEKVNPMLRDYAAIQDMDVQEYKDDLAGLSADELKNKLSQTEENIDKEVRKGNIPFLGSPLNWKRKKRALGKAAHDLFLQSLISAEGRLNVPVEGDSDKTTAVIINEEFEKFVEDNPALQGQFAREGFQEAVNPTILNLTRQYDAEKARIAKGEILLENTSDIYRLAKDATHLNSVAYDEHMKNVFADWSELNAFNPAQQLKVIENVAEQLAKVDEQKAYAFLKWSAKNLKVGNATFGKMEDQYDRMLDIVEREAEVQGRLDDAERADKKELIAAEFTLAVNAIQNTGEATFNGETFNDTGLLLKAYQESVAQDGDPVYAAQAQLDFEKVVRGDVDPDEHARREIIGNSFAYSTLPRTVKEAFNVVLSDYDDVAEDPRSFQLQSSIQSDLNSKIEYKIKQLIAGGNAQDPVQASQIINEFINDEVTKLQPTLEKRIQKLDSVIQKELKSKEAQRTVLTSSNEEAPEIDTGYFGDTIEEIAIKIGQANGVISNPNAAIEERKKAIQLLASAEAKKASRELADIAMGRKNKEESYTLPTVFSIFGNAEPYKSAPVPFTASEKKDALDQLVKIYAFSGDFADTQVLKGGKLPEFSFDIKKLDSRVIVLITPEEASEIRDVEDATKLPEDIVERARLVGRGDDVTAFINDQVKLLTRLGRLSN